MTGCWAAAAATSTATSNIDSATRISYCTGRRGSKARLVVKKTVAVLTNATALVIVVAVAVVGFVTY